MIRIVVSLTFASALTTLAACGDSTGSGGNVVSLSFIGAASGSLAVANPRVSSITDVRSVDGRLVISKAELVIREIALAQSEAEGESCEVDVADEDCEDADIGPLLTDLPLAGVGVSSEIRVNVPSGTYRWLEFSVQPPVRGNAGDAAFRAAHPQLAAASVRVAGTYEGSAFDLYLPLKASLEIQFSEPLVVGGDPVNVTVDADVLSWFTNAGSAIDPATITPGSSAEALLVERIKRSIKAFEDEDRDGGDDGFAHT